uniref:Uncharacterized protein n=1 Tax=Chromera velia CCMP2878 TaxID=1169474 RepID=A0A0G4F0Q7_9ALVE|eukprot:Cvel_2601.t1-p1 / transcript=Cvel_2601.t1 / gene=Cvel_2601 / organism=Chromera_velia_CCMP2878 / gene_product=hypothetical protein / transcript_product=hypothetical protein / location=Cvel_scaffold103:3663-12815(-) / protein_length=581 / sequence_SO=supercontig / SO=protein_coding / is_pseudo=false
MPVGTRSFRTQFTASCLILMLCSAHCIQVSNKAEHHAGTLARLSEYGLARSRAEHAFSSFVSKKETKTQLVEHRQLDSIGGECRYHLSDGQKIKQVEEHPCCRKGEHSYILPMNLLQRELLFLYLRATDDFLETPQKAVSLERVGGAFSLVALHYKPEVEGDILDCTVNDVKAGWKRCRPDMTSKQEVDMLMDLVKSIKERPCGRESFSQSLKDGTLLLRDIAECRMTDEDAQKVRELDQNAGTGRTACDIYLSAEKRMYIESAPDDETRNARTKEHKKELVDWMDKEGGIEKAVASEAKQVDALTEDAGAFLDLDGALPVPLSLSKLKRSSERGSSPSTWDVKMGHGRGGLHPSATLASSPELIEIGDLTLADARLPSFHTFSKDKLDLTDDRGQSIFGPPVLDKSLDGEGKQNNASSKTSFTQAEEVEGSSDPSLRFSLLESLDQIGFGDPLGPSSSSSNSSASSSLAREGAATGMVQLVKRDWESKEIDAQTMELREVLKHIGHLLLGIVMIAAGILCFALMILWPWSFLIAILIGLIFCAAGGHELSNGWAGCIIMSLGNPWLPLMAGGVLVAAEAF